MRKILMVAILATACGGDDGGPTPDQLTTPGADMAIACEPVASTADAMVGSWSLDWYCGGYTEGGGEQVPRACDPGRLPVGLDDALTIAKVGADVTISVGQMNATAAVSAGQATGSVGGDLVWFYACPGGYNILSIVDDYGNNSRTAWRARAERL